MSARYEHDCDRCTFLGEHGAVDLYVCARNGAADTVIARRSDEGSDYSSGLVFAHTGAIPDLTEAKRRAEALGIDCSQEYGIPIATRLAARAPEAT
jgi:NCAIR mutase (PurE)-related protein